MSTNPFSRRAAVWLVGLSGASLLLGLFFMIFEPHPPQVESAGPDAFSRSAIGHKAFVELLERLQVTVLVSRYASAARARHSAVLVVAEPLLDLPDPGTEELLPSLTRQPSPVLLVLPKRFGTEDLLHPSWIDHNDLHPVFHVESVLEAAHLSAEVTRVSADADHTWRVDDPSLAARLGVGPQVPEPLQLIESEQLEPLIATDAGILVGRTTTRAGAPLLVLSDPDLIANHALDHGDNAALALGLLDYLGAGERTVLFDETLHGHQVEPNVWRQLLEYPLVLSTVQVGLLLLVLVWATARRFGPPAEPSRALPPSKAFLIENTAELLRFGGHSSFALARYYQDTVTTVAQLANAPSGLTPAETRDWLVALGERRGVSIDLRELEAAVDAIACAEDDEDPRRVLATARRIFAWKSEFTDGDR